MADTSVFESFPETELINKIRGGKGALYELLMRRNNPYLYRIGRSYGYGHHDTEDLMQETYISAYCNLKSFEGRSTFKTWITRIMLNHCYQRRQRLSYRNEQVGHPGEGSSPAFHDNANTEKMVVNKELSRVLESVLEELPAEYRMVFTLRELNGLSVAETAEALDITETNVKVRLNRAKTMMRAGIEKMYSPADIYEFNLIYCNRIVEQVLEKINTL